MNTYLLVLAVATTALTGCKKSPQLGAQPGAEFYAIEEIAIHTSPLANIDFTKEYLNFALEQWQQVEPSKFYYESDEFDLPFLEGTFKATGMRSGEWRYYLCAGLKIRWGQEPCQYYLPAQAIPAKHDSESSQAD